MYLDNINTVKYPPRVLKLTLKPPPRSPCVVYHREPPHMLKLT